jgi:predicted alpha/beta hydrolase family esterase
MRTIFIIHGSYGNPQENWFPWLKENLETLGCRVFVPQFPIPENQDIAYGGHDLSSWLKVLDEYKQYINEETIFVAHSRGCVFLYRVLEQLRHPVQAVFFVGAWITYRWYPKGWKKLDSFHQTPFDWNKIKAGSILKYTNQQMMKFRLRKGGKLRKN